MKTLTKILGTLVVAGSLLGIMGCKPKYVEAENYKPAPVISLESKYTSDVAVAVGDMNGDGREDIILACHVSNGREEVYVFINDGDGKYHSQKEASTR